MDRRRTDEEIKELFKQTFEEEIRHIFAICQETTNTFTETHKVEHDFIKAQIAKEQRRQKLFEELIKQILGWGIIALVGGLGTLVWVSIVAELHKP